jgi:uncharacterized Zn finger protein
MAILFPTPLTNLVEVFNELSVEEIQNCFDYKVYERGAEYYENELIIRASYNPDKTQMQATVQGETNYSIEVALRNGKVTGSCTCPYGNYCKHVAAVLLYAIDDNSEIDMVVNVEKTEPNINHYLQSLSKDELIELVKKYAPQQFWVSVENSFSNSSKAKKVFEKVNRNVEKIFRGAQDLFDIEDFSDTLDAEVLKLSGLEKHLKNEIEELLFFIIREVDNAFDEGYLYDDEHYYSENFYEPSDVLEDFCSNYVLKLTFEEKITFLAKLNDVLQEQSHDTFSHFRNLSETAFTSNDLPRLKEFLITKSRDLPLVLVSKYYLKAKPLLSNAEREVILNQLQSLHSEWLTELVNLYSSQGQWEKAIKAIKAFLSKHSGYEDEKIFLLYLDILAKAGMNLTSAAQEALARCPSCAILEKIASLTTENLEGFELILKQQYVHEFFKYLQLKNRLEEAHGLIKNGKIKDYDIVFDFYKKYKKSFPPDAETFFSDAIYKNLEQAGDIFYNTIYQNLLQLKQINKTLATVIVAEIRLKYKRRGNLMKLLSELEGLG